LRENANGEPPYSRCFDSDLVAQAAPAIVDWSDGSGPPWRARMNREGLLGVPTIMGNRFRPTGFGMGVFVPVPLRRTAKPLQAAI
jgi:hypothetical protein